MNGFLLINKPVGPTSHDVIDEIRKTTGIKKVGHAGTLDPFADGLLIVAVGTSTKSLKHFVGLDKKYRATLTLGATSDTYDNTGVITHSKSEIQNPKQDDVKTIISTFAGKQKQTPPMYSAKKVKGKKLYELAREGKEIKRDPINIELFSIELIEYSYPKLVIDVHCTSGTYIRTLGHDIGQKLGTGAYLENLTRTAIGDFTLEQACSFPLDNWKSKIILSPDAKTNVMCFGTFDPFHKGHEYYLRQAHKFGKTLSVILTRDQNILKEKKHKPYQPEQERLLAIKQAHIAEEIMLGELTDYFKLIHEKKPQLICLGYDQPYDMMKLRKELKDKKLSTHVIRLDSYKPEIYKSSLIKKKSTPKT
ncbi:MAG: tRNA pseudouridine(55) synthase TruB [Candidatus Jacksonbacteria bacterium]|jgi:tRNA pseudouridine55 synthase|nr:tRNA pseudouridine(55) synthase TruB [Candidatus Jacksonbacteria bacterium]MBT6033978.1 tRNA pseudouridine(55) synthase TruB [Candidatus Jacksonbacteria bacterium]MBT6300895.1 tRNA pseudouridine(55) synthase TruB [Candidatus Jacksonbacteria bacterium]MBT6757605.1 tRNA pseudouridine(55) synthase TruB [Candidatus Jacksonbacteria bacterium]MBT6955415.1 tRNA pseudouridine(55) synthase TruB [Candidatus Jacksonbacteria bacterium]